MNTQTFADLSEQQRMIMVRRAELDLQRNPKNADAMMLLAGLIALEGDGALALAWLKKALAIRKKDPEILRRLLATSAKAKLYADARKYGRKLCEVEPRNAANHQNHGDVLERMGLPQQAVAASLKANRLDPGKPEILNAIARQHSASGDNQQARAWFERTLKVAPQNAYALLGLAGTRKHTHGEAEALIAAIAKALALQPEKTDEAVLCFAAGKVLDDCGQFDEAFAWFAKANGLRVPDLSHSPLTPFKNMKAVFTREFLAARRGYGLATQKAIFVVGMPRSGTTLTESICAAHLRITAGDEMATIRTICDALGRTSELPGVFRQAIERIPKDGSIAIARDFLRHAAGMVGDVEHFTDKMPHNFLNVGFIRLILPEAKIIHVRRHPLDNCLSIYFSAMNDYHDAYKTDLVSLGIYYRQYCDLMEHWRQAVPHAFHEVFYEDLVANTELNSRAIIDYLGLKWESSMLDRSKSQKSVKTLSSWQVRQPIYQSSKGKWRNYEKQLAPLIDAIGPYVQKYEDELANISTMARE